MKEVKRLAGYRPKSLEELNSLYDKSINVKNEIDKKASDLEVRQEIYTNSVPAVSEEETAKQTPVQEAAAEEISGLVDDFIKNFSAPAPVKRVRPVAPATVRAVSSAKNDEVKAAISQSSPVKTSADRPRLIRNSERNDLFEDYKKVMDDEDDDDFSFHRRGRKRGKKLFERKVSAPAEISENTEDDSAPAEAAEDTASVAQAAAVQEDIPETLENIDAVIDKVLGRAAENEEQEAESEVIYEISDEAEDSAEAEENEYDDEGVFEPQEIVEPEEEPYYEQEAEDYSDEAAYEEAEEASQEYEDVTEEPYGYQDAEAAYVETEKKSYAAKNILLCVLLLVIIAATAVSAVKAFAGINSDIPVLGKYHLYSSDAKYVQADIKKGDLVVVAHEPVEEGNVFAYKKSDGQYSFAKLDGVLNEDTLIADNDGQKSIVFKNTVRGTIYKTIPVIGTFAAIIASNYLYIAGGLLLLAAILLLVIVFAFRDKSKKVAVRPRKKAKPEAEREQARYDDVEGDFSYLIQDEPEEGYEVYREEYADETQEGLPAYEAEDYKYEPDEYVNN